MSRSVEEPFVGCVAGNLRAAARAVTRVYDSALRETGLRITQVAVLAQVHRRQPVTITGLAVEVGSERSAVARDLAILERDGLVSITRVRGDLRAREVRLTAIGERRLAAAEPAWRSAQQQMTSTLGARDVEELVRLSSALVTALAAEPGPSGRPPSTPGAAEERATIASRQEAAGEPSPQCH